MGELETFCETLFGDSEGFVYSPYRDPNSEGSWTQKFFMWPKEKDDLYRHITERTKGNDVYLAPALFRNRAVSYETVLSVRAFWAEFDGKVPERLGSIPSPTIKIQSSTPNHEHWYWILQEPLGDCTLASLINKKLAYSLEADLSGWDATQVLRPPTTYHHESGKIVSRISESGEKYSYTDFSHVEEPTPVGIDVPDVKTLPDIEELLARYRWDDDTYDLFRKPEVPVGSRSSSLTRLAFSCSEMGMSDREIVSVLLHKDKQWKKYNNRADQLKRLAGIVAHVRSRQIIIPTTEIPLQALRFEDFLHTDIKLDWIVQGILPVAGQAVLFGDAGCGKTTLTLRLMMAVARGENYLTWQVEKCVKTLFISAEMPHEELKQFFLDMQVTDTGVLQENLFLYPVGHGLPLSSRINQELILNLIDRHNIEVIVFDSLSVVAGGSTNDDQAIIKLNQFVNAKIRRERKCAVLHIHHSRKPDKGSLSEEASELSGLYGSHFIAANALTVLGMSRNKKEGKVTISYVKGRYLERDQEKFDILNNRDFGLQERTRIGLEDIHSETKVREEEPSEDTRDSGFNFGVL